MARVFFVLGAACIAGLLLDLFTDFTPFAYFVLGLVMLVTLVVEVILMTLITLTIEEKGIIVLCWFGVGCLVFTIMRQFSIAVYGH